ncbi:Mu transposase C-terminal domain-containing protein [Rhizobium ruizarguesonis]|uniref:Integrase catalytic domain-containing protein n=1 Tax=Rhizobium ruizarguesonis TaxID=2081791 RepID=A0ABY1X890_9HYPH|nr:Mu transposase C-terminal domain-containing protein [Rhizobium ruizarguesonis]TAX81440.1 hypothetical protein ELH98_10425 [Rhizobium ruizarguesonis]
MTIDAKHFEFLLQGAKRLLTKAEMNLPETPADHFDSQAHDIVPGDEFLIYSEDHSVYGVYVAQNWVSGSPHTPRQISLIDPRYNSLSTLSSWQISYLLMKGRLRPRALQHRDHDKIALPGSSLSLTAHQVKKAHRVLEYVDHYQHLCVTENYGRPSLELVHRARKEVGERRAEKPLGKTAIYEALAKLAANRNMDRLVAVAPLRNQGNQTQRFSSRMEEVLLSAVRDAWADPRGTWKTVKSRVGDLCSTAEYIDLVEEAASLSKSTYQRRFANVDQYSQAYLRYGEEYANRISAQHVRLARPDHPLDVVDVDHTSLNVTVFDDLVPVAFGRPDIIVFRDRHSGAVVGFHIGFEAPSFSSFIAGLKHTIYPKDPRCLPVGASWPWYGVPVRLGVDHASHFVGDSMANAQRELGFQVIEYRPGRPWEKGAMEHLFAVLGMQIVDRLPGSTTHSPDERKKFEAEAQKAKPVLSISELRDWLTYYFAEIYNREPHIGLGALITLPGKPCDVWKAGIGNAPMRPLIDPDVFTRLVGYHEEVSIQSDGIRLDYLHYQSAELVALRSHPKHKAGTRKHRSTKYTATRNPNDLSRIWVRDPYRNVMIDVPVAEIEKGYTKGLTLFQHRKIIEHHNKTSKDAVDVTKLIEARRQLERDLAAIHTKRKKHGTATALARFFASQAAKFRQTRIIEVSPDGTVNTRMNYAKPLTLTLEHEASAQTVNVPQTTTAPEADPPTSHSINAPAAATDIETLKARHTDWED